MAKFLSDDYLSAATEALAANESFQGVIVNVDLTIQFTVTDTPSGDDIDYTLKIADGTAGLYPGVDEAADVTVTNSYDTAAGISKGQVNTQMAFMQGKLKVGGNMAALLMNQNVINEFATALSTLDVEY